VKKLIFILLPLIILGGVAGLVFTGIIKTPWTAKVAHKKNGKEDKPVVDEAKADAPVSVAKTEEEPPKRIVAAKPKATQDPDKGAKKLAKTWDEVDTKKLVDILKTWKDPEAAQILVNMDTAKVAEILSALDTERAAKLSRVMQQQAAVVKAPA